jgi:uncharacterized protein
MSSDDFNVTSGKAVICRKKKDIIPEEICHDLEITYYDMTNNSHFDRWLLSVHSCETNLVNTFIFHFTRYSWEERIFV